MLQIVLQSRNLRILNTYLGEDTNIAFSFQSYFLSPWKVLARKDVKLCICKVHPDLVITDGSESVTLTTKIPKKSGG